MEISSCDRLFTSSQHHWGPSWDSFVIRNVLEQLTGNSLCYVQSEAQNHRNQVHDQHGKTAVVRLASSDLIHTEITAVCWWRPFCVFPQFEIIPWRAVLGICRLSRRWCRRFGRRFFRRQICSFWRRWWRWWWWWWWWLSWFQIRSLMRDAELIQKDNLLVKHSYEK